MKAALYDRYGGPEVIHVGEAERPEPGPGEILVKVFATSVTTADWRFRASAFPPSLWLVGRLMAGLFRPKHAILGLEFAGRVVGLGEGVERFRGGDRVFGFVDRGAHAEYLKVKAEGPVALMPENLGFEEAAGVPFGGLSALVFLRDFARLKPGMKIMVNGSAGGVGVWAVQLARHMGADVTAVASSASANLVRSLGAGNVIDYKAGDPLSGEARYDVILDTVGKLSFGAARRALKPGGRFVPLEFGAAEMLAAALNPLRDRKIVIGVSGDTGRDLEELAGLLADGTIRPVIDSTYPLEAIVEAHRRVESRRKHGSVIVAMPAA